jgi:uncharacterized protein YndB with AHSA1/START domain
MIRFNIATRIRRPVGDVFAYVTDPGRLATWQTNTVSAVPEPDGPLRLGSRLREVHRAPGGREIATLVEVVEYVPDRVFALNVIEGTPVNARITFDPWAEGTLMDFAVHARLRGALRLAQPLLRAVLRRQFAKHCETLRRVLEQPPAP